MLTTEDIQEKLKKYKLTLQEKYNVKSIGLFGSYIHGDQTEDSDVDVLVEFSRPIGWKFIDLKDFLEEILEKEVDLVTVGALKPQLRDEILKEVVYQ